MSTRRSSSRRGSYRGNNSFGFAPSQNPPPARFGTGRRDAYGNQLPGEFDASGRPLATAADGLTSGRQGQEAAQAAAHWDKFFPTVKTAPAGGTPAVTAPQQGPTRSGATVDAGTATPEPGLPKVGDTRPTAFGGSETLMDSKSGPRWVGSTASAPAATNFMPGDAGTKSLADHVQVQPKPLTAPLTSPTGNKETDAANLAANMDMYKPGGMSETAGQAADRAANGNQATDAFRAAADTGSQFKTAYGDVQAIHKSQPLSVSNGGNPVSPAPTAKAPAPAPVVSSASPTQPAPAAGVVGSTTPSGRPYGATPAAPARLSFETDADVAARQAASKAPVYAADPTKGTTGFFDALGKGNLSAAGTYANNAVNSAEVGAIRKAGDTMGAASDAIQGTAGAGTFVDDLLQKGRTAFGAPPVANPPASTVAAATPAEVPDYAGGYLPTNSSTIPTIAQNGAIPASVAGGAVGMRPSGGGASQPHYRKFTVAQDEPAAPNANVASTTPQVVPNEARGNLPPGFPGVGSVRKKAPVPNMASGMFPGTGGMMGGMNGPAGMETPGAGSQFTSTPFDSQTEQLRGNDIAAREASGMPAAQYTPTGSGSLRTTPTSPNFAKGFVPKTKGNAFGVGAAMQREKTAIAHHVGGARRGDKPVAVRFPGVGPEVINTGEKVVPNAAGGQPAILTRDMLKKGRTAFGAVAQPLKRAVASQPKRADLVHTSRWN